MLHSFRRWLPLSALFGLVACTCTRSPRSNQSTTQASVDGSIDGKIRILRELPHDRAAFTQGLQVLDGKIYESTGLEGQSALRRVDLESGVVEQKASLPTDHFGEGLTFVGQRILQLTWLNKRALVWDVATFRRLPDIPYEGEGWGLCYDGKRLVMSDGSDTLAFRDPVTFAKVATVRVRLRGQPLAQLNELECVGGLVFANVWQSLNLAAIDASSGEVVWWFDASPLFERLAALSPTETMGMDVLNGIAYLPQNGHFLLTGKRWPRMFEVTLATRDGHPLP